MGTQVVVQGGLKIDLRAIRRYVVFHMGLKWFDCFSN